MRLHALGVAVQGDADASGIRAEVVDVQGAVGALSQGELLIHAYAEMPGPFVKVVDVEIALVPLFLAVADGDAHGEVIVAAVFDIAQAPVSGSHLSCVVGVVGQGHGFAALDIHAGGPGLIFVAGQHAHFAGGDAGQGFGIFSVVHELTFAHAG